MERNKGYEEKQSRARGWGVRVGRGLLFHVGWSEKTALRRRHLSKLENEPCTDLGEEPTKRENKNYKDPDARTDLVILRSGVVISEIQLIGS